MHIAIGGQNFVMLPILILLTVFFGGTLHGTFVPDVDVRQMVLLLQMSVLMTGLILGGFAFMAPEIAEKRFGDIKLLVAQQPYLPIEVKRIYFLIYVKDILFYSTIILAPIAAGLFGAALLPMTDFSLAGVALLSGCMFLTFTLGFALAFAVSMAYMRSKALGSTLIGSLGALVVLGLLADIPVKFLVPPVGLNLVKYSSTDMATVFALAMMSFSSILAFSAMAIAFSKEKWESREHTAESILDRTEERFSFTGFDSLLVAKEFLDMKRSGGTAKIAFTFVMPMGALFMIKVLSDTISDELAFGPEFYALTMGFFGMLIYYMISSSDYLNSYQVLPISPADVIRAKLKLHIMMSVMVSIIMAIGIGLLFADAMAMLIALPIVFIGSVFMGVVMAYLTGFRTAEMLLEPKFLGLFTAMGALPLSLAAALYGVLGRDDYQDLVQLMLMGIAIYVLAGTYVYYSRIENRWMHESFVR